MTIAEVSRKYDISADTLRYYERIGLIDKTAADIVNGYSEMELYRIIRDYGEDSCRWIEMMKCMRKAGVQIEALIEYVALFQQGDDTAEARKAILVEQRERLMERMADMQASLERLNQKIERYEQVIIPAEKELKRF